MKDDYYKDLWINGPLHGFIVLRPIWLAEPFSIQEYPQTSKEEELWDSTVLNLKPDNMKDLQNITNLLSEAWNLYLAECEKTFKEGTERDRTIAHLNRNDFMFHINALHRICATDQLTKENPGFFQEAPLTKETFECALCEREVPTNERTIGRPNCCIRCTDSEIDTMRTSTATPGLTHDQMSRLQASGKYRVWEEKMENGQAFLIHGSPNKRFWPEMSPEQREEWVRWNCLEAE